MAVIRFSLMLIMLYKIVYIKWTETEYIVVNIVNNPIGTAIIILTNWKRKENGTQTDKQ